MKVEVASITCNMHPNEAKAWCTWGTQQHKVVLRNYFAQKKMDSWVGF